MLHPKKTPNERVLVGEVQNHSREYDSMYGMTVCIWYDSMYGMAVCMV